MTDAEKLEQVARILTSEALDNNVSHLMLLPNKNGADWQASWAHKFQTEKDRHVAYGPDPISALLSAFSTSRYAPIEEEDLFA